jgi:hypothetical protein
MDMFIPFILPNAKLEMTLSNKARDFFSRNKGLSTELLDAQRKGVGIRVVEVDTGSGIQTTLRVIIEINEHTTNTQIRDAAPLVLKVQELLMDYQGLELSANLNDVRLDGLSLAQGSGSVSYGQLAKTADVSDQMTKDKMKEKLKNWRNTKWYKSLIGKRKY